MADQVITLADKLDTLDKRARPVYDYIIEQIRDTGVPPTLRDIARGLGLSSSSVAFYHFQKLKDAGLIVQGKDERRYAVVGMKMELDKTTPIMETDNGSA